MQPIQSYLAKYKVSFKTAAVAWGIIVSTFYANDAFHSLVMGAYAHVPSGVKGLIVGLAPVAIALYEARAVIASTIQKQSDAPTK